MEMMQVVKLEDIKVYAAQNYLKQVSEGLKYLTVDMRTGQFEEFRGELLVAELAALRELGVSAPACLIQMY